MLNLEQIRPVFIDLKRVTCMFSCWLDWNLMVMNFEHVCKLSYVEEAHEQDFPRIWEQILH